MVVSPKHAIHRNLSHGPQFGDDIVISDNANTNENSRAGFAGYYQVPKGLTDKYTILAGTEYFSPDDWEVFYRQ